MTLADIAAPLELLALVIALVAETLLALSVVRADRTNTTNRIFAFLSLSTMLWLAVSYLVKVPLFAEYQLLLVRLGIFFAAPMSVGFFLLAHTIPARRMHLSRLNTFLIFISLAIMMALNISPLAFTNATTVIGTTVHPVPGIGFIPFAVLSTLFSIAAVCVLIQKFMRAKNDERHSLALVLGGMVTMLLLIIATVLIPILAFGSAAFLPLVPLYTLLFLGSVAYAIVHDHLFNLKVIAAQAITFSLWAVLGARLFYTETISQTIVDGAVFLLVVIFGTFLIKSVQREVEARQHIEILAKDLERANMRLQELDRLKSEFLSIASHQMRSPLTAIKGYASLILEGSYGTIAAGAHEAVDRIFKSVETMISVVENFLNISRIEQGSLKYEFANADVKTLAEEVVHELLPVAVERKLSLSFLADHGPHIAKIDSNKLKQVFVNLVDNALKYTPNGSVKVAVSRMGPRIRVSVSDSGVGMTSQDIENLFKKFSRAKDASKVNTQGTGLGLYIAKEMVEANKGKIWAESKGKGRGASFIVELQAGGI